MRITVPGSASCISEVGNDSAHDLLNDSLLIGTGWNAVSALRQAGCDGQNLHMALITTTFLGFRAFCSTILTASTHHRPNTLRKPLKRMPALSYRIQDGHSAAGFTGDTAFHEAQSAFFDGTDLVISKCSLGRQGEDETKRIYGHSGLDDIKIPAAAQRKSPSYIL